MRASVRLVRHIALLLLSGCSLFGAEEGLKPASETEKMWDTHRQKHTHENPHSKLLFMELDPLFGSMSMRSEFGVHLNTVLTCSCLPMRRNGRQSSHAMTVFLSTLPLSPTFFADTFSPSCTIMQVTLSVLPFRIAKVVRAQAAP